MTPDVVEWVNSLIENGEALPKDSTTEERLAYQYKLNKRMKRLSKLQRSLKSGGLAEEITDESEEEDHRAQERPTGKHRSRTRDMPPEVLGATHKDLNSGFSK